MHRCTCRGAGTDANVFIELRGSSGSAGEVRLDNHSDNFRRGRADEFSFQASDVGELQRCVIRWASSTGGAWWGLEVFAAAYRPQAEA